MAKKTLQKGLFITVEGMDGAGKSTQIALLKKDLEQQNYDVVMTREPGGTALGERLRDIFLHAEELKMDPWAGLLMVLAARRQHIVDVIEPALKHGAIVISDRFSDATMAYQGYGEGLDKDRIRRCAREVGCDLVPHGTLLLDVEPKVGLARLSSKGDRFERKGLEFFCRVREGYLDLAKQEPARIKVVRSEGDLQAVFAQIKEWIDERIGQ